jgi:CBS domain-containing protein
MLIANVLDRKGTAVATITAGATLEAALDALAAGNIGALVVIGTEGEIAGIVSERDIVRALHREGRDVLDGPVAAIMSTPVFTATPSESVESLMATMTARRFRHVPILVDGRLGGIVSIGDVVKSRTDELERDRELLVDYIRAR